MVKQEKVGNEFMLLQPFKSDLSPPVESGGFLNVTKTRFAPQGHLRGVLAPLRVLQDCTAQFYMILSRGATAHSWKQLCIEFHLNPPVTASELQRW